MSVRSIILGLCLGLFVASSTFFSDYVVRQTFLIGNLLPISVFGILVLLTFAINPLARVIGFKSNLRAGELAIITVMGLAACGFPSSGFYRTFYNTVTLPAHWLRSNTAWQSTQVMSYVPGASPDVAAGHVMDFPALHQFLLDATKLPNGNAEAKQMPGPTITERERASLERVTPESLVNADAQRAVLAVVNQSLIQPTQLLENEPHVPERSLARRWIAAGFGSSQVTAWLAEAERYEAKAQTADETAERAKSLGGGPDDDGDAYALALAKAAYFRAEAIRAEQKANRAALVAMLDGVILPQPQGSGWLTAGGRADPFVTDAMLLGRGGDNWLALGELPWYAMWPTIRMWVGLFIVFALATLCLAVIVHPQWSRHELLSYPIPRFVEEVTRREGGAWLPEICRPRLFWVGAGVMVLLHTMNGLHAWFDFIPGIPLRFDFNPMSQIFPELRRVSGAYAYFSPTLYPTVIAFTFFLAAPVGLSLGISQFVYMLGAVWLRGRGIVLQGGTFSQSYMCIYRFGTYLGMFLFVLYIGRRYYTRLVCAMVGAQRTEDVPPSAVWASRILVILFGLMIVILAQAGMSAWAAIVIVLMLLMMMVITSRIAAETGMIMVQVNWLPVSVLTALFGFEAIGPTLYICMMLLSVILMVDPREAVMPFFVNALQIADRSAGERPRRTVPWIALMLIIGVVVAGGMTMYLHYNTSSIGQDAWGVRAVPTRPFLNLSGFLSEQASLGTLATSTSLSGGERLAAAFGDVRMSMLGVLVFAVLAVILTAIARLRLPWWPIHPVLFLIMATYPVNVFSVSFLLGWLIKVSVTGTSGARGYQNVKPLMVGVITGELAMGLGWIFIGTLYYMFTGQTPVSYRIFPG